MFYAYKKNFPWISYFLQYELQWTEYVKLTKDENNVCKIKGKKNIK